MNIQFLNSNIFVCLGASFHLDDLRFAQIAGESVYWTIKKTAKPEDIAIFYLTSPISAIVGFGEIIEQSTEEPESEWKEKFFTTIDRIKIFDAQNFIKHREILTLFPEWRYFKQPRQSALMPEEIKKPFWELIRNRAD